jgi:hypothetical protein
MLFKNNKKIVNMENLNNLMKIKIINNNKEIIIIQKKVVKKYLKNN